jgi:hypothetical protein
MTRTPRFGVTRNSMLMAKPSGVCGNPSDSGSGDNSQRMHQLSGQQTGSLKPSTPMVDALPPYD